MSMGSKPDSNERSWERANRTANSRKGNFAEAIRSGWSVIPPQVLSAFPEVAESRVLHLMCNDGREAAYLSTRRGFRVTGVDFSNNAIRFARSINRELGLRNIFVKSNAIDWMKECSAKFQVVYLSLGTMWWVQDLSRWFISIRDILESGGILIMHEFHPIVSCYDDNLNMVRDYPFEVQKLDHKSGVLDYTADPGSFIMPRSGLGADAAQKNPYPVTDWKWSLQHLISAVLAAGGCIHRFEEYPFIWGEKYLSLLVLESDMAFRVPRGNAEFPLSFLLVAQFD